MAKSAGKSILTTFGDDVVDVLNKCGSDAIVNVELYKQAFMDMVLSHGDEYLRLYQRYGQPVTEKCIIYADELSVIRHLKCVMKEPIICNEILLLEILPIVTQGQALCFLVLSKNEFGVNRRKRQEK